MRLLELEGVDLANLTAYRDVVDARLAGLRLLEKVLWVEPDLIVE